jgi:hypothetical protein
LNQSIPGAPQLSSAVIEFIQRNASVSLQECLLGAFETLRKFLEWPTVKRSVFAIPLFVSDMIVWTSMLHSLPELSDEVRSFFETDPANFYGLAYNLESDALRLFASTASLCFRPVISRNTHCGALRPFHVLSVCRRTCSRLFCRICSRNLSCVALNGLAGRGVLPPRRRSTLSPPIAVTVSLSMHTLSGKHFCRGDRHRDTFRI